MIKIIKADIKDKNDIKNLYFKIYGNFYSLPEVQDDDLMSEILNDSNNVWVIAKDGANVIGSLLFRVNKDISMAKAMAAVVSPDYRGKGIFKSMFQYAFSEIDVDIIYALTRTVLAEPQKLLLNYGFLPLGVFPNVRRVYAYENHGLYAFFKPSALKNRKKLDKILPEVKILQNILKDIIVKKFLVDIFKKREEYFFWENFIEENADIVYRDKFNFQGEEAKKIDIKVIGVEEEYKQVYSLLRFKFFPFHKPNFKITTEFGSVFLHLNMLDKHCAIMGIEVEENNTKNLYNLFFNIPYIVDKLDARYLEIISLAYKYINHSILIDNGFIPSAYFPSFIPEDGFRSDAVIFFYPYNLPHFKNMFIPDVFKAYIKYIYTMIVKKITEEVDRSLI